MTLPDESRDQIGKSQEIGDWLVHPPQSGGLKHPTWYRVKYLLVLVNFMLVKFMLEKFLLIVKTVYCKELGM